MSNYYDLYKLEQQLDITRQRSVEHTNWMNTKGRLRSLDDKAKELVRNLSSHTGYPKYYAEQIEIEFMPAKDEFKVYRLLYCGEGNYTSKWDEETKCFAFPARWLETPLPEILREIDEHRAIKKAREEEKALKRMEAEKKRVSEMEYQQYLKLKEKYE